MSRDAFDRFTSTKPSWYYEIIAPGFKYNLTDIAAAMGLHQLKRVRGFQARRDEIALAYHEAFADLPLIRPPRARDGDLHSWHLYVLRLADHAPIGRDEFIERLFRQGIGCSVHYVPLHQHPYWRDRYALTADMFPHSEKFYQTTASIPIYSKMTDAEVDRVIRTVRDVLSS